MGGLRQRANGITSSTKIIANIFISFIGAGMLGLPYAFKEAGIVEGAVIMSAVGYLSTSAMLMLIDCKYAILAAGGRAGGRSIAMEKKAPLLPQSSSDDGSDSDDTAAVTGGGRGGVAARSTDLTYGDVGHYAFGAAGKRLVDLAVVVSQLGFCCGYLIYLCKNLSVYAPVLSQHQWLLLLLPPLYCLALLRHLNKLAVFSLFAQVSNVFALAVVFWFDFSHSEVVPFVPKEFSLKGMPFFFAVAIYCYEGAGLILSMEESVAESKRPRFRSIFVVTMMGLTVLYVCFGASGYLSFGPHTEDIITLNLPHGEGAVDFAALVKVCLGISLFFTYPMMLFPVSHLLDKTCGLHTTLQGNLVRLVGVCTSGLVVLIIPNFGVLISLIGATCCTLLAFILPALFHLKIFRARMTKRQWYFNWLLVCLGALGSIVGLWDTFNRMGQDSLVTVDELSHAHAINTTSGSSGSQATASLDHQLRDNTSLSATVAFLNSGAGGGGGGGQLMYTTPAAGEEVFHAPSRPLQLPTVSDAGGVQQVPLPSLSRPSLVAPDSSPNILDNSENGNLKISEKQRVEGIAPVNNSLNSVNVVGSAAETVTNRGTSVVSSKEKTIALLKQKIEQLEQGSSVQQSAPSPQTAVPASVKQITSAGVKSNTAEGSNSRRERVQQGSVITASSSDLGETYRDMIRP